MASIKIFAKSDDAKKDGWCKVYLQLIHSRKVKYLPLDISIIAASFDFENMECKKSHKNYQHYNSKISQKIAAAELTLLDLADRNFTPDQLAKHILSKLKQGGAPLEIKPFVETLIMELKKTGRQGNAKCHRTALQQIEKWHLKTLTFSELDYTFLNKFKIYKLSQGIKPATVSAYFRSIRVWFNEAANRDLISKEIYPFKRGLIPARQRTAKKNLDVSVIQKLIEVRPALEGRQRIAVNCVLLQFYLQGCDLVEVVRLQKAQIDNEYIRFTRYKNRSKVSNPEICVKLLPGAMEIINENRSDYFVQGFEKEISENFTKYETRRGNLSRALADVCTNNNLPRVTFKSIRHTWATIAASLGVREEIREIAMGHSSGDMQSIYTNIDQKEVDQANERVFEQVIKETDPLPK